MTNPGWLWVGSGLVTKTVRLLIQLYIYGEQLYLIFSASFLFKTTPSADTGTIQRVGVELLLLWFSQATLFWFGQKVVAA